MVVAHERLVHRIVDPINITRVPTDQVRCNLFYAGACASGMGRDIVGTEGRAFTPAFRAVLGRYPHDDAVKTRIDPPA